MTNLASLLGGIDLNDIFANIKNLRTLGPAALESLRNVVRTAASNDPAVKALLAALENILDPIIKIPAEELNRLDESRHSINIRVSHDYTHTPADPPPVDPPAPAEFPYFTVLDFDPRNDSRLSGGYKVYQSQANVFKFYVTDGKIGGGRREPDAFVPNVMVGGEEVGGDWKLLPR